MQKHFYELKHSKSSIPGSWTRAIHENRLFWECANFEQLRLAKSTFFPEKFTSWPLAQALLQENNCIFLSTYIQYSIYNRRYSYNTNMNMPSMEEPVQDKDRHDEANSPSYKAINSPYFCISFPLVYSCLYFMISLYRTIQHIN